MLKTATRMLSASCSHRHIRSKLDSLLVVSTPLSCGLKRFSFSSSSISIRAINRALSGVNQSAIFGTDGGAASSSNESGVESGEDPEDESVQRAGIELLPSADLPC